MTTIDQIIRQSVNPFDPATFKPGNFWHEPPDPTLQVDSIHQKAMREVETILDQVAGDHRTRTLLLYGDSGSGKSHLLGRLKRSLNPKAFFVYVDPFPDRDAIWRHVLRYTVDSLVQQPDQQEESQLLLWLKGLSAVQQFAANPWGLTKRQQFIRTLKKSYGSGIYNATEFFGVLYDLLDPERYAIACEWLRGDDLDDESLELLKVKGAIATEDAAQKILANFGKIAAETKPIVLCFDQLDNIARAADGVIDLQALFDVNSSIHNQGLKNFLVMISIITSTWKQNADRVQQADRVRIDASIPLKPISLQEAAALWACRLLPLHQQADRQPESAIYPLERQTLEEKYPGGKTQPRLVLELGRRLIQTYKVGAVEPQPEDAIAALKLLWRKEFQQTQEQIHRIKQFAAPELIKMLEEALTALQVGEIRRKFLPSPTYASHSFSYHRTRAGRVAIAWNEDANMLSFYHVMNACRRAIAVELCKTLYLIRSENTGKPGNKGHEFYLQIFSEGKHRHIQPDLDSVHYLATYHSLVNATYAGELVVAGNTPDIEQLESLIRDSELLQDCKLLKQLGILSGKKARSRKVGQPNGKSVPAAEPSADPQPVQEFLLDLLQTHRLLGRQVMVQTTLGQFSEFSEDQINQLIQDLAASHQVQVIGSPDRLEEQLICLSPTAN